MLGSNLLRWDQGAAMRARLGIVLLLLLGALAGAPPTVAQTAANPFGIAVIIGNDYRGLQLPGVDFASNDADAIAKWVVNAKGFDPRIENERANAKPTDAEST
jgi:hypothetical protein